MSPWEPHEPESPRDTYRLEAKLADTEAKRADLEVEVARLRALVEEARGVLERVLGDAPGQLGEGLFHLGMVVGFGTDKANDNVNRADAKVIEDECRALLTKLAPASPGGRET